MTIQLFSDPSHGWAKIAIDDLKLLGIEDKISSYSYLSPCRQFAYLEEDQDFGTYLMAVGFNPVDDTLNIAEHHTNSSSKIRNYSSYRVAV